MHSMHVTNQDDNETKSRKHCNAMFSVSNIRLNMKQEKKNGLYDVILYVWRHICIKDEIVGFAIK